MGLKKSHLWYNPIDMKNKLGLLFILPLLLTSCGEDSSNPHIYKNGDLLLNSEITFENSLRETTADEVISLMNQNENFCLYFYQTECSHCQDFKPKLVDYVKNTSTLFYSMNIAGETIISEGDERAYLSEEFAKLIQSDYGKLFFPVFSYISTPAIFIASGDGVPQKISNSRISTTLMFTNAMNEEAYTSSVYSFKNYDAYLKFKDSHLKEGFLSFLIDRSLASSTQTYINEIQSQILNSSKDIALVELNEVNKESFYNYFSIDSFAFPIGIYQKNEIRDEKVFYANAMENQEFLDLYL